MNKGCCHYPCKQMHRPPSFKYTDMGSSSEELETKVRQLVPWALMLSKAQPNVSIHCISANVSIRWAELSSAEMIWSVKCSRIINQGNGPSTWMSGNCFLPELSYGTNSVQWSITDDKGLCCGAIELILKKIVRCFHALQSQLQGGEPHQYVAWAYS